MTASLQTIRPSTPSVSQSRLARARVWLKRSLTSSRARRALGEVDSRTLRDIGVTRRQLVVIGVAANDR